MSTLVLTLIRFGFLLLIWLFVFSVMFTLRRDIYGTELRDRRSSTTGQKKRQHARASQTSAPASAQPASLTVTDGPLAGTTLPLGNAHIVVGRSPDCALVLNDAYSSSRHARFYLNNGQWWIEDLDSTNGTFIKGHRITSPQPLEPGTPVVIGHTTMEIR